MHITIQLDSTDSADWAAFQRLAALNSDVTVVQSTPAAPAAPAKAAPRKAAPAKVEPTPEPEPEAPAAEEPEDEDVLGGGAPTVSDAIARATEMVSNGQTSKVKAALAVVKAKRVSEVTDKTVAAFMTALDEQG